MNTLKPHFDKTVSEEPMVRFFAYDPHHTILADDVAYRFAEMACEVVGLIPRSPELTVALRKLLESRDAAIRCAQDSGDE